MTTPIDPDDITLDLDELVEDAVDRIPQPTRAKLYRLALAVSTVLGGLVYSDVIPDTGTVGKVIAGVAWLTAVLGNGLATAYTRPAKK